MIGVRSNRKMITGLQMSERITTANYPEPYPYWQNVMNEIYDYWGENRQLSKSELLQNLFPHQRRLLILGNLNAQICNGGFSQWICNGYYQPRTIEPIFDALKQIKTKAGEDVLKIVQEIHDILEEDYTYNKNLRDYEYDPNFDTEDNDIWYGNDIEYFDKIYYKIQEQFCHDVEKLIILGAI